MTHFQTFTKLHTYLNHHIFTSKSAIPHNLPNKGRSVVIVEQLMELYVI